VNDDSEGQDIDEGNEVEKDTSVGASVSTSRLHTPQSKRIHCKRKMMKSGCWTF
jgi:hypothetical protein